MKKMNNERQWNERKIWRRNEENVENNVMKKMK